MVLYSVPSAHLANLFSYSCLAATVPRRLIPFISPCHFFHALATPAFLEEYWILTFWLSDMYFFWVSSLIVLSAIFAGSEISDTYLTPSDMIYSRVLPGNPYTNVKSPSRTPPSEILKNLLGVYGTLSSEYSAGLLSLSA